MFIFIIVFAACVLLTFIILLVFRVAPVETSHARAETLLKRQCQYYEVFMVLTWRLGLGRNRY